MKDNIEMILLFSFLGLIFIVGFFMEFNNHYNQVNTDLHAVIDVKYCSGERDTLTIDIRGTVDQLEIDNRSSKHSNKAVPEFKGYKNQIIAYNVCWFNILSYEEK